MKSCRTVDIAPHEQIAGPSIKQVAAVPTRRQRTRRLCWEAAALVLKVMRPACTSGPLAWILTYVFTLGNVLTGLPPALQSDRDMLSMTMYVSTSFHGISLLAPYALSLRNFHHLDGSLWTPTQLVARFVARTSGVYTLVHVLVTGGTYAIISTAHDLAGTVKPHLYLACVWNSLYRASVDEASRRVYQRETLEGVERGHVNDAPYWRRYAQAVGRSLNFTVIAMLAASLVHACSALDMLDSSFASLKFSVASVILKSVVLTITKRVALKHGGTHLRKIYVLTAVPTVLINTQVRLVLLQNAKSGSSVRSFLELGMLEPVIRITKVWHLKHTLKQAARHGVKPVSTIRERVRRLSAIFPLPSSLAGHGPQTARPRRLMRRATIFDSHQSLLHFHAAESHADMCSEYIAIICSTSVFFFMRHHSRFGWHKAGEGGGVDEYEETLLAGSWQVGIEIVVDFVCCVFELANGIPAPVTSSVESARRIVQDADYLLVSAGAGLSASAGLNFRSEAVMKKFHPTVRKALPGFRTLYNFIAFPDWDEPLMWGFYFKNASMVWFDWMRYRTIPTYSHLKAIVDQFEHREAGSSFVQTTNVDGLFEQEGFDRKSLFVMQGDFGRIQCAKPCSQQSVWDIKPFMEKGLQSFNPDTYRIENPADLPRCPKCGGRMSAFLREDETFLDSGVADDRARFEEWLDKVMEQVQEFGKKLVILEVGIGFNTPGVLRVPDEQLALQDGVQLVRVNEENPEIPFQCHGVEVAEDATDVLDYIAHNTK